LLALRNDWKRGAWAFFNQEVWVTRKTFWRIDLRGNAKSIIEEHTESVRAAVPAERLLEYKVTEGWYVDKFSKTNS
jgi:hypothetical protein